ncbi:MAG: hypothetical protein PHW15_00980 [Patescibacteria group bacterium]|jgi:uncharacterized membrane protein YidH (DUF202 family)|nr:hypothetical protein [Patescibacteria group bacterium]MDD5172715.1 hypothetical protein [Patescibacteria group bacterium]
MKSFKIYLKEGGVKSQLTWLGALLTIVGITILAISLYNYFTIPQEAPEEFILSPHALIIKELYISGGMIVFGLIFILAGTFAVPPLPQKEENNHGNK